MVWYARPLTDSTNARRWLQVLERVVPLVDNSVIQATIKPCLADLAEDPDVDVQFYARQALFACDNVQMQ